MITIGFKEALRKELKNTKTYKIERQLGSRSLMMLTIGNTHFGFDKADYDEVINGLRH